MTDIETIIMSANLSDHLKTSRGDCVSIASAIQDVFGGTPVVFYSTPERKYVTHAIVEMDDNQCYDGDGYRSFEGMLELATLDAEEMCGKDNFVDEELFVYKSDVTDLEIYEESTKKRAVELLQNAKENVKSTEK
jgi:hypothetical protein